MPRQESEESDAAPPAPSFTTPTKHIRNDGAGHGEPDAEGTDAESDYDIEKKFDESTGKKRTYHPYLKYTEVKRWITCEDSILKPAEIKREIYMLTKKFMQQSRLMKAPGHKELQTDIGLWKQHRAEYYNLRTEEWILVMKYLLSYRCKCKVRVRIIARKDYKLLGFFGTHDENSHAVSR